MSVKANTPILLRRLEAVDINILRYVFGSTIAMALATGIAWELSFLLPVLSLGYFAPGSTLPTLRQGSVFVVTIVLSAFLILVFTRFLLDYTWAFLPVLGLALFGVYYTDKLGAQNKLFVLMNLLLIPMLGFISIQLAYLVALGVIIGAVLTLILVWSMHAIIPDIHSKQSPAPSSPKPNAKQRYEQAKKTWIIVFPVVVTFFFFQWAGGILVLIFIAILSMMPNFSFKAGMALILGNLLGGIFAILFYEIICIVPIYSFMVILIFLTALYFAGKLFSGKKTAPLYGMSYSTLLLIIGQSTSGTDDAGGKVWTRVIQILLAVLYVVIALSVLHFIQERKAQRRIKNNNKE